MAFATISQHFKVRVDYHHEITATTLTFQGTLLTPTDSTRNLGFIFDKDLSAEAYISSVCISSYFQIRQLRQVRSSLDKDSAIILANSLVFFKLDYCNSLYYNLPAVSLDWLQNGEFGYQDLPCGGILKNCTLVVVI